MPRLFVALPLPPEIAGALAALRGDVPGARWTPAGKLHLTLKFVGEVEEERVTALAAALEAVRAPAAGVRFTRREAFPNARRASVLVAAAEAEVGLMLAQAAVENALHAAGVPRERRPFHPHVTLARVKEAGPAPVRAWLEGEAPALAFTSPAFVLYESRLDPSGAVHTPLARYPLGRSPP